MIGIYKLRYLKRYEYLILIIFLSNIVFDLIAINLGKQKINNSFCYNLLNPIELILTLIIYYNYFPSGNIKKILAISMSAFLLFAILNIIFIQNFFTEFDNYTFFIGGVIVSVFSYFVWRNEILNNVISPHNIILWFAAANFIYYTLTIPIMSAHNWLSFYSKDLAFPIYAINKVIYGIWAIIIGIGLIWKRQRTI